jgi:hypothetical protein
MPIAAAGTSDIVFLFAGSGLVLYIAARAGVDAITDAADPQPGRMALAHWMPIAWTALIATIAGRSEIGIGVALASSVAAMGLALGVLLCVSPDGEWNLRRTAAWPFVLPAGVLALIAGFSGALNWLHALFLLLLGACVRSVWVGRSTTPDPMPLAAIASGPSASRPGGFPVTGPAGSWAAIAHPSVSVLIADPPPVAAPVAPPTRPLRRYWLAQLLLAVAIGAVGGWLGYKATIHADERTRVATSGLISLAVLSPLLILPMLGTGAVAAHHGKLGAAMASIVALVLLNLCLLVPLVVAAHYVNQLTLAWPGGARTWEAMAENLKPMPYPLPAWRIDTVLLIVLGLLLIPVSLGRWRLGRIEGLGLTFVYAAYLIVSTILTVRM